MKRIFSLLLIITFASHFGTNAVFAQKRVKRKEVIIIEFSMPNRESPDKWEIPINKTPKGSLDAGGGMVSECGIPDDPECAKTIYSAYKYQAKAFAVGKSQTRIDIKIEYTVGAENCQTRRTLIVYRKRQAKIRLGCGANLLARYGPETKEAN
jgi:hypothetical protein